MYLPGELFNEPSSELVLRRIEALGLPHSLDALGERLLAQCAELLQLALRSLGAMAAAAEGHKIKAMRSAAAQRTMAAIEGVEKTFPALHARSSLPCHAWRSAQGTATAASSACSATPTAGPIVAGATADAAATVPISVMKRATNAVEAEMPFKAVPTKPPAAAVEMWVGTISKGSPKFVQSVLSSARRAFESCGANRCSVSLHEKEIRVSLGERLSALSYGSLVGVRALLPVSGSPLTVCWVRTFPLPPPRSSGADERSPIVMKIKAACDESVPAIAAVQSQLEAIGGLVEKIEYAGGRSN